MKILTNRFIPIGKQYSAINLLGVIFVKSDAKLSATLLNHEAIHTAQMRELGWLPFYIIYVGEWLLLLLRYKGNPHLAYRNISFEREAYNNALNLDYLKNRKPYSQWRSN